MMKGPGCRRGLRMEGARIIDLAPTLLSVMGVPVPGDMDGRVLTEAFEDAFAPAPVSGPVGSSERREGSTGDGYSDSEAREVSERLRSMGYLD